MDEPIETFEHWGVKVEIHADYDAGNPYEDMEQASRIVGFEQLHRDGFSAEAYPTWEEREPPVLARWLTVFGGEAVAIPFVFNDYGSGGYRAYLTDVDNDRAAGFVCVSREKVAEEWPDGGTIDGEQLSPVQMAERCARGEFATWAAWLEGDVCGFVVAPDTEEEDSCWGFYGPDAVRYTSEEARSSAEWAAFEGEKRRLTARMFALDPDADPASLTWPSFYLAHAGEDEAVLATWRYSGQDVHELRERSGDRVVVLRRLGADEADEEVGPMYRVRFEDGHEADAFESELSYLHVAEREAVAAC